MPRARRPKENKNRRREPRPVKRLTLQSLEPRRVLAAIAWNNPAGGAWDVGSNWSTGNVPAASDDVTIDTATAATITIQSGDSINVNSVTTGANDTLSFSGGSLTASASSFLSGPLTMTGGSLTASGPLTNFTADVATSISGASLHALSGATLSLPQLKSYASNASTLEANGSGSALDLAALTTVVDDGPLSLDAVNSGEINLNSLTSVAGSANPDAIELNDVANARIVDPAMTRLDFVNASLDGTDSQVAASWTSFSDGSLAMTGGTYHLSQLSHLTSTSLNLSGASLTLPNVHLDAANSITLAGNADLQTTGDFTNYGALTIDAGSKLNVGGSFTQLTGGTLNVQFSGSSTSGQFGQIAVQNAAALAGTLNIFLNGYVPESSDDFKVLTFASATGNFATVAGLAGPLTEILNPTSLDLSPPPDAPQSLVGVNVNTSIGAGFYSEVASFSDASPSAQAGEFVISIDWGDGTTTSGGNVSSSAGHFQVYGFHDYSHAGAYPITTTVVVHGTAAEVTSNAVVVPTANGRINVTTSADTHAANPASSPLDANGNISLRSAIEYLNATALANQTVDFDGNNVRGPVQLNLLSPIEIDASLTIDGSGVYQLAIGGSGQLFQIDKFDGNNLPVSATISNLTLNLGPLSRNNMAAFGDLGSLTFNKVNLTASIAYFPVVGDDVALVSGAGQIKDSAEINGVVIDPSDDAALNDNGNIYPFKANYSPDGLTLSYDASPSIRPIDSNSASSNNVVVARSNPVPASDVVADWRFQEGTVGQPATGPIVDSSGNGLNGTPIGNPVYSSNVPSSTVPQTGQPDNESLEFNGTNQQVFVPDSPQFRLTHSLTLEVLVDVTAAPQNGYGFVLFRGDNRGGLDPYTLIVQGSGSNLTASFNINDASNDYAGISAPLPGLNQWLDIVGTLDDATGVMRLYINGVEQASTVTSVRPFAMLDPTQSPGLGIANAQSAGDGNHFQGLINEARICDVALTPDEFLSSTLGNFVVTDNGKALLNEPVSNLASLTLDGSNGGDIFDVTPDPTLPIVVHGDAAQGTAVSNDTLVLPQLGNLSQTFSAAGGYSGTWSSGADQPVSFDGINTLDLKQQPLPTSSVQPLPAVSPARFTVSWSGNDAGGPGIAKYNVFLSDNGGPWTAWLTGTTATSDTWQGALGHTYGFYSVAIDALGQPQPTPSFAQATTQAIIADANGTYVAAVYQDVLGRAPDANGLAYWTKLLDQGTPISSVAEAIAHSDEYYADFVIKPDYLKLLGRAADDAGVKYWTTQMDAGLTDQQLEADLVSSSEFYQSAGGNHADWLNAVYKLLLGRTPDAAGLSYWLNQLSSGESLSSVADSIAGSTENNTQLITDDYFQYLGRAPDSAGLGYWLGQFGDGRSNEDVIAGFTGSQEYYKKQTD